ncbi:hypothetical protein [Microvirga yunnanensis]|uniref:hypothetical protein n=1 Tax=Microvirga yunnanensis TaxID=2953740 RepID=UPI0021C91678|nr:hypothetical protein [Microvirga sp. HBU67655]
METTKPSPYDVIVQGLLEGRDPVKALDEAGYAITEKDVRWYGSPIVGFFEQPLAEPPRAANDGVCTADELAVIEDVVSRMMARARKLNVAAAAFKDALGYIKEQVAEAEETKPVTFTLPEGDEVTLQPGISSYSWLKAQKKALQDRDAYLRAISLVRSGKASKDDVIAALGRASPDGDQGNVWELWEKRQATTRKATAALHLMDGSTRSISVDQRSWSIDMDKDGSSDVDVTLTVRGRMSGDHWDASARVIGFSTDITS